MGTPKNTVPALFDIPKIKNPFGSFYYDYAEEDRRTKGAVRLSYISTFLAALAALIIAMVAVMLLFPGWGLGLAITMGVGTLITELFVYSKDNKKGFTIVFGQGANRSLMEFIMTRELERFPELGLIQRLEFYAHSKPKLEALFKAFEALPTKSCQDGLTYDTFSDRLTNQGLITELRERIENREHIQQALNSLTFLNKKGEFLRALEKYYGTNQNANDLNGQVITILKTLDFSSLTLPSYLTEAFTRHLHIEFLAKVLEDLPEAPAVTPPTKKKGIQLPPTPKTAKKRQEEAQALALRGAIEKELAALQAAQAHWAFQKDLEEALAQQDHLLTQSDRETLVRELTQSLFNKHKREIITKVHAIRGAKITALLNGLFMGFAAFTHCTIALWHIAAGNFATFYVLGATTPLWCLLVGSIFGVMVVFAWGMLIYKMFDSAIKKNLFTRIWEGLKEAYLPKRGTSHLTLQNKASLVFKWILITAVLVAILALSIYVNLALAGAFLVSSLQVAVLPLQFAGVTSLPLWASMGIYVLSNALINLFILPALILFALEHSTGTVIKLRSFCTKLSSGFVAFFKDPTYRQEIVRWAWKSAKALGPLRCIGYVLGFLIAALALITHVIGEGAFAGEGTFAPAELTQYFTLDESPFEPIFAWCSTYASKLFNFSFSKEATATISNALSEGLEDGDFVINEAKPGWLVRLVTGIGVGVLGVFGWKRSSYQPSPQEAAHPPAAQLDPHRSTKTSQVYFDATRAEGPAKPFPAFAQEALGFAQTPSVTPSR